jgi:hypothetical protein
MHKGGPLAFLSGEVVAQHQELEVHRLSNALSAEAASGREQLILARIETLRHASFPDETAYFRDMFPSAPHFTLHLALNR